MSKKLKPLQAIEHERKLGRIRSAMLFNKAGDPVQVGDTPAGNGWLIATDVPDAFAESVELSPAGLESATALLLPRATVPMLSIAHRTAAWQQFTLLPLVGDTVLKFLRWGRQSGQPLRLQFNSDTAVFEVDFSRRVSLDEVLEFAQTHRLPGPLAGYEGLVTQIAAVEELHQHLVDNRNLGHAEMPVVIATVELPEIVGAQEDVMRAICGDTNH